MPRLCHILLFLLPMISVGQNLVPNPSFEENDDCPTGVGQLFRTPHWTRVGGSGGISYYHECAPISCGIPVSRGGGGFARTGQAYVDLSLVHNNHLHSLNLESNFLGIELLDTLEEEKQYVVEFYLSLFDSARFACKNVGALFSQGQPTNDDEILVTLSPQFVYQGDYLDDKLDWMKISGTFIAEGDEDYLTIGNFLPFEEADTINLNDGGVVNWSGFPDTGFWEVAYYFIDDVSVVEDTTYHVGIAEPVFTFTIYPNPATTNLTIESRTPLAQVWVRDVAGRLVLPALYPSRTSGYGNIDVSSLPSGIYLVEVLTQNGQRSVQKVVVE